MVRTKPINWSVSHCMPPSRKAAESRKWLGALLVTFGHLVANSAVGTESTNFSPLQIEFYEKQVQPILAENCYKCHSHQADKIKGSFIPTRGKACSKAERLDQPLCPANLKRACS